MGIWDWLCETFAGRDVYTERDEPAVATLEPPGHKRAADESEWWERDGELLTELEVPPRPRLSDAARAFENSLISQLDGHNLELPQMPRVPEQVLRRLGNPNCNFDRLAECIAEDQVTATAVLRMANSPLYRGVDRIASLNVAIGRLGTKALRVLMMSQSMRAVSAGCKGDDRRRAEMIWLRSRAGAAIMRSLATFVGTDGDEAFLIGLLHDIGNVIVVRELREQKRYLKGVVDDEIFEYLCFECHQEFGELIAEAWSLPPKLQALLSDHHRYPEADDPLRTERLLLHLADMICALLGYAPDAPYDLLEARAAQDLGLAAQPNFETFLRELPTQVDEAIDCL